MNVRACLMCITLALSVGCSSTDSGGGVPDADPLFPDVTSGLDTADPVPEADTDPGDGDSTASSGDGSPDEEDGDDDDSSSGDASPDEEDGDDDDPSPDAGDGDGQVCTSETCEGLGATCGLVPDGCDGELNCGACAENEACSEAWQCECQPWCIGQICGEKDGCDGTCLIGSGCCTHDCDTDGAVTCDGASVTTCGQSDNDECLDLKVTEVCAGTSICHDGACCTPACGAADCDSDDGCGGVCGGDCCEPECVGKICGESDGCGDTCLAGSGCCSSDCAGQACGESDGCGGTCEASCCEDECLAGQGLCVGPSIMVCGDYDNDACLDWSELAACDEGSCVNGECVGEPDPTGNCQDPIEVIAGPGGTGNGVCDADNLLEDDGQVAEFWAGTDNTWDFLEVPVSNCRVVDFGLQCAPSDICVKFWAGVGGCSGDGCNGACGDCMTAGNVGIHVFAYPTNSTMNFVYQWSAYADETSDPGKTFCYKPTDEPMRYVLVCRAACGAESYNAHIDHVWLQ